MRDEQKISAAGLFDTTHCRDEADGLTEGEEPDLLVFCNRDSLFYLNPDGLSEGASGLTVTSALWGSRRKQSRDQLSATTKQKVKESGRVESFLFYRENRGETLQ